MVATPVTTPVTEPVSEPMTALALLLVHKPPPTASLSADVAPAHTVDEPSMGPGERLTVTVVLA